MEFYWNRENFSIASRIYKREHSKLQDSEILYFFPKTQITSTVIPRREAAAWAACRKKQIWTCHGGFSKGRAAMCGRGCVCVCLAAADPWTFADFTLIKIITSDWKKNVTGKRSGETVVTSWCMWDENPAVLYLHICLNLLQLQACRCNFKSLLMSEFKEEHGKDFKGAVLHISSNTDDIQMASFYAVICSIKSISWLF